MIDFGHFPTDKTGDLQIFTRPSTVTNTQWLTWQKPRGCTMAYILALGGGGGGGGGFTAAATNARGGGGGGGSAGQVTAVVPIWLLPDTLYIQVGAGSVGVGSGGGVAGTGLVTCIAPSPSNTNVRNILITCTGGVGGTTGTGAAAGAAGAGGTASTVANMIFSGLGVFQSIAGQSGGAGGAQTGAIGAATLIAATGTFTMGGSGGAGTASADFAGGECSASAGVLLSEYRPATPAAGSFNGSGGPVLWKPFFNFSGLGGSSSNTGVGGQGGNAAYGSGGGGGGGGTTGGTGGTGGNGIVIIYAW